MTTEKMNVHEVSVLSGNPSTKLVQGTVRLSPDGTPTQTLCVLDIPDYISINELWHFLTSTPDSSSCSAFTLSQALPGTATGIVAIKLLRNTSAADKYAAIIVFDSKAKATNFLSMHNGKRFVSLGSPDTCIMFYVDKVDIPDKLDCFGPEITLNKLFTPNNSSNSSSSSKVTRQQSDSTCSFCTEVIRIEDPYPILITLCGHCFHAECISRWTNGWCPLCRCHLQPLMEEEREEEEKEATACSVCGCNNPSSLWECLFCANVGCDKCMGPHASAHYEQTEHLYAFNIESKLVWDFIKGDYVRRIVLNKTDGKPVEVDSKDEKIANIEAGYLFLMDMHQMSVERNKQKLVQFHEREINRLKGHVSMLDAKLKDLKDKIADVQKKNVELKAKNNQLAKENAAAEKIIEGYSKRLEAMSSKEKDNDAMVRQMKDNAPLWKKKFDELERKYKAERDKLQAEIDALQKENEKLMSQLDS